MGNKSRTDYIYQQYQNGKSSCELAKEFEISRQRVSQIVAKEATKRGEHLRSNINQIKKYGFLIDTIGYEIENFTIHDVADRLNVTTDTLQKYVDPILWNKIKIVTKQKKHQLTFNKYKKVYNDFMSGKTLKQLAFEYKTSVNAVGQYLNRYRKETGLRCKTRDEWITR